MESSASTTRTTPLLSAIEPPKARRLRLIVTVAVVTLGSSMQFGFATGVVCRTTAPHTRPRTLLDPCGSRRQLNNLDKIVPDSLAASGNPVSSTGWSSIVSGFSVGGLLGCAAATQLCLLFGRKTVLLLNNIFVVFSSLLFLFGASWDAFFGARVLIGIAAGIATGVVPLYLSEICPSSTRAAVGTAHQLGIASGLLLSQVLTSPELCPLGNASAWRGVFVVPLACAILEVLVLPFCPESPAYLYKTQGSAAALSSLTTLQSLPSASGSLDLLRCEMVDRGFSSYSVPRLFQAPELRKQLVVGLAIQVSMQCVHAHARTRAIPGPKPVPEPEPEPEPKPEPEPEPEPRGPKP